MLQAAGRRLWHGRLTGPTGSAARQCQYRHRAAQREHRSGQPHLFLRSFHDMPHGAPARGPRLRYGCGARSAQNTSGLGRDREGLSLVLGALARHPPRYQRSMANYARLLVEPEA
ncbi:hypothetical protein GCM10027074_03600 [Streptomyces deserti]